MAWIAEQRQRNVGSGSSTPGEFAREEVAHLAIPPGGKQSGRLASSDERRVVGDRVPEAVAAHRTTETYAEVVGVEVGYVLLVYPDFGSSPQPVAATPPANGLRPRGIHAAGSLRHRGIHAPGLSGLSAVLQLAHDAAITGL